MAGTGKFFKRRLPELGETASQNLSSGLMSSFFTFFSNVGGIKFIIEQYARFLFPIAFGLAAAEWLFLLWLYLFENNKNLSKTSQLLLKFLLLPVFGLAVFGVVLIGAAAVPLVFTAMMSVDVLIALAKTTYYAVRAVIGYVQGKSYDGQFYAGESRKNLIRTVVSAIIVTGVVVTMIFMPQIALTAITVVALTTSAVILAAAAYGLYCKIKAHRAAAAPAPVSNETVPAVNNTIGHSISDNNHQFTVSRSRSWFNFHDNTIQLTKALSTDSEIFQTQLDTLRESINEQRNRVSADLQSGNLFPLWNETPKRQDKLAALGILETVIDNFNLIKNYYEDTDNNAGLSFNFFDKNNQEIRVSLAYYDTPTELMNYIQQCVLSDYPRAFQSFNREIGNVEVLFHRTRQMLMHAIGHPNVLLDKEDVKNTYRLNADNAGAGI